MTDERAAARVSLNEFVGRLEASDPAQPISIDRVTATVLMAETVIAPGSADRYATIFAPGMEEEAEIARQFVETRTEPQERQRLSLALASANAAEAFEAAVYRSRIAHEWFQFRGGQLVEFARRALTAAAVPYRDDVPPVD